MYDPNTDFYDNPHDLAKEKRLEKVIQVHLIDFVLFLYII